MNKVAVIGAGAWGTAISLLLARNGNSVRLWGSDIRHLKQMMHDRANQKYLPGYPLPPNLEIVLTLSEAVDDIRDIFIIVPSRSFLTVLKQLKTFDKPFRIASGTKGVNPKTHQLLHECVFEIFSRETPIAIFSGPSFAKEVAAEKPTAVNLASNNSDFLSDVIAYLRNPSFYVYANSDLIGLQLCGALKNVLAIAVGISDGMDLGPNVRAALITRGLVEMGQLCAAMGAYQNTLLSMAGVGDLILTCTDDQSRNRRFGKIIGQGYDRKTAEKRINQSVEGLYNVDQIHTLSQEHNIKMPITKQVYRILFQSVKPSELLKEF